MPWISNVGYVPSSTNFSDIPRLDSYEAAKAHYDSVKPWRGSSWSPLAGRRSKIKRMREEPGGTIVVRFYETDLVDYNADGTITICGYRTLETGMFLDCLLSREISLNNNHPRHDARGHGDNMVLYLNSSCGRWCADKTLVVRCDVPATVKLVNGRWMPQESIPFRVPVIDRRLTREVSKRYRLAQFIQSAKFALHLQRIERQTGGDYCDVAEALKRGDFAEALHWLPVGRSERVYGRWYGGSGQINPGFLDRLRLYIYETEGALTFAERDYLTLAEYDVYRSTMHRMGHSA